MTTIKNTEKIIPVKWSGWDQIDINIIALYDVEFTEDFGEFKSGEEFKILNVDYEIGYMRAYGVDGIEIIKSQEFKCVPIN